MQVGFARLTRRLDTDARQLLGCSDLEILTIGTRNFVIASGEADGGFSSYEIMADGSLTHRDDVVFDSGSGTASIRDMTSFERNGVTYVVPMGRYDDNMAVYAVGADGRFTLDSSYSDGLGTYQNLVTSLAVTVGGNTMFYSANASAGLDCFTVNLAGELTSPEFMADTPLTALGDVSAMVSANLQGRDFLFAASSFDTGLSVYEVNASGALTQRYYLQPGEVGFNAPTALETAQIGDRAFLIMASAETDSLLVFRVSVGGQLKLVDEMIDISETRIERPSVLKMFEYEGRHFLLAAGSDDGVTLFEVDYRGRLELLSVLADDFDTTLDNISDIEVKIIDGAINVFVSSPTEHGFTQFLLDLTPDNMMKGGAVRDNIEGTAGDDTIYGFGKSDILKGNGGNDRLIDGRGRDQLWGGEGADKFVFIQDGRRDKIMDFEQHIDRIDFSDYPHLFSFHDLEIKVKFDGAIINIGDEVLWITSHDGQPIDPDSWVQEDFIFG